MKAESASHITSKRNKDIKREAEKGLNVKRQAHRTQNKAGNL